MKGCVGFLTLVVRDRVLQWEIGQSLGDTQPLSLKGICGNNVVLCVVSAIRKVVCYSVFVFWCGSWRD